VRPAFILIALLITVSTSSVDAAFPASPPKMPATVIAPSWPLLQALEGKVVLVDFWASWCSPCLRSFPWMNELQKRFGGDGFEVVAVNLDQDRALADAFLEKVPVEFRVEYDPEGNIARQFDVQAMPSSFLIDRNGRVRVRHAGFRDRQRQEREANIRQLLEEEAS